MTIRPPGCSVCHTSEPHAWRKLGKNEIYYLDHDHALPWCTYMKTHQSTHLKYVHIVICPFFFFFFFFPFRATPAVFGSSGARGHIGAATAGLHHSHSNTTSEPSATYTTTHGNAGYLTHRMRPGIKPTSSWMLVGFIATEPQQELLSTHFKYMQILECPFFFSMKLFIKVP